MVLYTPPQPARAVPVIDMSPSFGFAGGDAPEDACASIAWDIHKACRDTGFFYVTGHGVPAALVAGQFDWARRFFALPLPAKMALHMSHSPTFAGYEPVAGQTLDADSPPDLKEGYYYSADLPDDDPYLRDRIRGYGGNLWPADVPGFDAAAFTAQMRAYYAALRGLGDRLLRLLARSLGLPAGFFAPMYRRPQAVVRLLHYPPHPAAAHANQLGAGAHTDWGGITLLAQDDAGGLEVMNMAGDWIVAPPLPDTFVVNLGDLVQRWSNDRYRSNMHRVLNQGGAGGRDRYSVPFFYTPDHHARIECLPGCSDVGDPPHYPPCTAGEHMTEMFNRTYGRKAG